MLLGGAISEAEMWRLPARRFFVYLKHACRIQGEDYLNLLAIATNPHLYDKQGKGKMQEALFKRYDMQIRGDSPERQGRLRSQLLKDMAKSIKKKKNGGND